MSPEPAHAVVAHLAALDDPLFALLDAARDPAVLATVRASDQPHQSLFEGAEADDVAEYGPWLVALDGTGGAALVARLVAAGWGRSWGVYLTSPAPFDAVRHHFRRYLRVELPGGAVAAFRFYDPRVLRNFLATWTPEEREDFFGPVACIAVEDEAGGSTPGIHRPAAVAAGRPGWRG